MSNLGLDREVLANITNGNQKAIKALERVFDDVAVVIPEQVTTAINQAAQAVASANQALGILADLVDRLELLAHAPTLVPQEFEQDYQPAIQMGSIAIQDAESVDITGGAVGLSAGTVALPSFYMVDRTTGLYRAAANEWRMAVAGVDMITYKATGLTVTTAIKSGATGTAGVFQLARASDGAVAGSAAMNVNVLEIDNQPGDVVIKRAGTERIRATATGATVAGTIDSTAETRVTQAIGGAAFGMWSVAANVNSRNFVLAAQSLAYGQCELVISNARLGDPIAAGTVVWSATLAGLKITAGFGCNTKAAQASVASGAVLAAYAGGANGLATAAAMQALVDKVTIIDAMLKANGIAS